MTNENPNPDPVEEGGGEGGGGEESSQTPAWAGPSQDEWTAFVESQKILTEKVDSLFEPLPEEDTPQLDVSQLDLSDPRQLAQLVGYVVDSRMEGIAPFVKTAAQEQGKARMIETFKELEKKPEIGKFDYDLAERAALSFFEATQDAEGSVIEAAKYAARVKKEEREAAVKEYQEANSRRDRFNDPEAVEGGLFREKPAKSYDEVLERYAEQDEV